MPNGKSSQLSNKTILTLEEAAQRYHFSASELLDKAASGVLQLCVWIPDHVIIYSVKLIAPKVAAQYLPPLAKEIDYTSTVRLGLRKILPASFPYEQLQTHLNAFTVSKEDCIQISKGIPVKQRYFERGYYFKAFEEPEVIYPWILSQGSIQVQESNSPFMDPDETIVQKDRYFAIFPKHISNEYPRWRDTQEITLTLDNLLITTSALEDFIDKQSDTLPTSIFTPHARTSKALIKIAKTVKIFWSHTNPSCRGNYPRSKEIQLFLMNNSITPIPEYLAKAAARLICPIYAKKGYTPQKDHPYDVSMPVYITTQFIDMIRLSELFWNNSPPHYATNELVADAFRNTTVVESDVMHAAMLIRPDGAPKGKNKTHPTTQHL